MNRDAGLLRYLQEHTLIGIRVGPDRVDFVDIWMVEVSGRLFARSWNRSTRGWYGALLEGLAGDVRFGDRTLPIVGRRLDPESPLMSRIDRAYLERFHQPENIPYAQGISQPDYHPYTMEILPVEIPSGTEGE
ncbi:MAG: DUF2255 family protein [Candidatus Eisenbacteria bacterium]|uniref:DUF2255 family protein n=1 Tax=Eiseniibacteriota bacterium TaxID=2212470 RepID=A0A956M568_UNCEI|nr:DUF2255 family protein [Candidatus Eisenbacteria bacterium]